MFIFDLSVSLADVVSVVIPRSTSLKIATNPEMDTNPLPAHKTDGPQSPLPLQGRVKENFIIQNVNSKKNLNTGPLNLGLGQYFREQEVISRLPLDFETLLWIAPMYDGSGCQSSIAC